MKRFLAVITAFFMLTLGFIFTAAPASAHTPDHSASCKGVTASGTSWEVGDTLVVTVDDQSKSDKAGKDGKLSASVSVPQDYVAHSWTVVFTSKAKQYNVSYKGQVGPCKEKPEAPKPLTEKRDVVGTPDCKLRTVTTEHQSRTQADATWNGNEWVPGAFGDWKTDSTTSDTATAEQCPPPVKPEPVSYTVNKSDTDCKAKTVTIHHTTYTTDWVLKDNVWVKGETVVTTSDEVVPATEEQCPTATTPPVTTPPTTSNPTPITGTPGTPVKTSSTTPAVKTPVSTTSTTKAAVPVTVKTQAPQKAAVQKVSYQPELAATGLNAWYYICAGLVLLAAGAALLRIKPVRK